MTAPQGPNPPAWHPDPERPGMLRWWDGERWTDHRQPTNLATQATQPIGGATSPGPPFVPPPTQGGVPKWLVIGGPILVLLIIIGVVVAVAAGGDDDDDLSTGSTTSSTTASSTTEDETTTTEDETTTTEDETTTTEDEPTTTEGSGKGTTRDAPLALGESAQVGDYTVTVTQFTGDATMMVTSANEFNDPPTNGAYGLVNLAATYTGDSEGDPSFELTVTLSGGDAVQYVDFDCAAVAPDPALFEAPTLEPGGTAGGNLCLDYPLDALPGSVLFVESTNEDFETARRYWATG